jgi:hypothetical protein
MEITTCVEVTLKEEAARSPEMLVIFTISTQYDTQNTLMNMDHIGNLKSQ